MKQVKPHALVVVHSKEIDDAGEANVGLRTFRVRRWKARSRRRGGTELGSLG